MNDENVAPHVRLSLFEEELPSRLLDSEVVPCFVVVIRDGEHDGVLIGEEVSICPIEDVDGRVGDLGILCEAERNGVSITENWWVIIDVKNPNDCRDRGLSGVLSTILDNDGPCDGLQSSRGHDWSRCPDDTREGVDPEVPLTRPPAPKAVLQEGVDADITIPPFDLEDTHARRLCFVDHRNFRIGGHRGVVIDVKYVDGEIGDCFEVLVPRRDTV